jgi:hypothetical protein
MHSGRGGGFIKERDVVAVYLEVLLADEHLKIAPMRPRVAEELTRQLLRVRPRRRG